MNKKNFLITSIIVIVIVAVITSLISISLLQKPLLPGPEEEGLIKTEGLETSTTNVIILDIDTVTPILQTIPDDVVFKNVVRGFPQETGSQLLQWPKPFVIRNQGTTKANVSVYSYSAEKLFTDPQSAVNYSAEKSSWQARETDPVYGSWGPTNDECQEGATLNRCYTFALYEYESDQWGPLPWASTNEAGLLLRTNLVDYMKFDDVFDEVFVHIKVYADAGEPVRATPRSTTIVVWATADADQTQ